MNPFLIASFESALGQGLRYMALLTFALAFILIVSAGWQWRTGRPDEAKSALLGAVVMALASVIAEAFFRAGGLPTVNIGR